jgi:cellulose synthase/poly-beta-1,6-N-acetylglucosamine synthase-like glycosyltransferase
VPQLNPSVTVIVPVLDEIEGIEECLASLATQDYPGDLSVVVADGGSTDGTRERVMAWSGRIEVQLVDNPRHRQAPGLDLAAGAARGEILVRGDGHTVYAPDYVATSIRALQSSGAGAVGGALRPVGTTRFGRAVAAAMRSRLATGPAKFHRPRAQGDADTVYLGAFARSDYLTVGGFRDFPSGAGEDADFYFRMRRRGLRVHLDPAIRSEYRPRRTPAALFRQHFRYGRAKSELLWANGVFPSARPLAPALLVLGLVAGLGVGPALGWWPLIVVGGVWLLILALSASSAPRLFPLVVLAGIVMHLAYGLGVWWGLVRGPGPVRRSLVAK